MGIQYSARTDPLRQASANAAGSNAVLVERERLELKTEQARDRLDAGIGELFREDHIARPGEGGENDRRPVLCAVGDDHSAGIGFEPCSTYPRRACGPMARHPCRGLVEIEKSIEVRTTGQARERPPHRLVSRSAGQTALAQIDQRRILVLDRPLIRANRLTAHEGSPTDLATHQAATLGGSVGSTDGAEGDAEPIGELAVGGELVAGAQASGLDVVGECFDEGEILGVGFFGDGRGPHCHSNNVTLTAIVSIVLIGVNLCIDLAIGSEVSMPTTQTSDRSPSISSLESTPGASNAQVSQEAAVGASTWLIVASVGESGLASA